MHSILTLFIMIINVENKEHSTIFFVVAHVTSVVMYKKNGISN